MKICLECAEGGHLDEILGIMDAFIGHEIFFVTGKAPTTEKLSGKYKVYYVRGQSNIREKWMVFFREFVMMFKLTLVSFILLVKERPKIILSTGGGATIPLCYIGKLLGVKIVYMESMARVKKISGTGKIIYPIADLFLVQWKSLLTRYKKAKFWGSVI